MVPNLRVKAPQRWFWVSQWQSDNFKNICFFYEILDTFTAPAFLKSFKLNNLRAINYSWAELIGVSSQVGGGSQVELALFEGVITKMVGSCCFSIMLNLRCFWVELCVEGCVVFLTFSRLFVCCPVEQLPTITAQSPSSLIAFPFDESFPMTCEAKGNPEPEWVPSLRRFRKRAVCRQHVVFGCLGLELWKMLKS